MQKVSRKQLVPLMLGIGSGFSVLIALGFAAQVLTSNEIAPAAIVSLMVGIPLALMLTEEI